MRSRRVSPRSYQFQSTPPRGRRRSSPHWFRMLCRFQSTPPRGRRRKIVCKVVCPVVISIHASAREATFRLHSVRSRTGISIHASAREATKNLLKSDKDPTISIHASAREATLISWIFLGLAGNFNPRLREGGDCILLWHLRGTSISIHASAREATRDAVHKPQRKGFQSTPPRGRRLLCCGIVESENYFNPRLREGGDGSRQVGKTYGSLFQSTPPRGRRRRSFLSICCNRSISIHASAREATVYLSVSRAQFGISIHASAREATQRVSPRCIRDFNPRLREGGDKRCSP